jgi:RNA polymerase sigma factor (TIGR02999 family)
VQWENRRHFFGVAAQFMRRILVDHARKRNAAKRGGARVTVLIDEAIGLSSQRELDLVALDNALKALAELDERQCRIVELRFFGGLSIEDTSTLLGISPATVKREWSTARAWLYAEISGRNR